MRSLNYQFTITPLTEEDGGGFLIEFRDLPGCMSDGESIEETIRNGEDAVNCWLKAAKASNRPIPKPGAFNVHNRERDKE